MIRCSCQPPQELALKRRHVIGLRENLAVHLLCNECGARRRPHIELCAIDGEFALIDPLLLN